MRAVVLIILIMSLLLFFSELSNEGILRQYDGTNNKIEIGPVSFETSDNITLHLPEGADIIGANMMFRNEITFEWFPFHDDYRCIATGGDINGDGYQDIVGMNDSRSQQELGIFYGTDEGYPSSPDIRVALEKISIESGDVRPGDSGDSELNFHIDGDVNGDGYSDLVFSYHDENVEGITNVGTVRIFSGGPNGLSSTPDVMLNGTSFEIPYNEPHLNFGHTLDYAGDVNDDGFDDLVATIPKNCLQTGVYFLMIYGKANISMMQSTVVKIDRSIDDWPYSYAAGLGDLNEDGYGDIGVVGYNLIIYFGGPSGIEDENKTVCFNVSTRGRPMTADLNNDAYLDIVLVYPRGRMPDYPPLSIFYGPFITGDRQGPDVSVDLGDYKDIGYARTMTDVDSDGYPDYLLSHKRWEGSERDIPTDLAIYKGTQNGMETEPSWTHWVTGYPNDTFIEKASTFPDPHVPNINWTWVRGAEGYAYSSKVYFMRQPVPYLEYISLNGVHLFSMDNFIIGEHQLDITNEVREALNETPPNANGTITLDFGIVLRGDGAVEVKGIEIEYYSVMPPREVDAQPLPEGNAIVIQWTTNNDDATLYRLLSNRSGEWKVIAEMAAMSGTYIHNGLLDGITYYYRFQAMNPSLGIVSDLGMIISATPSDSTAPPIPLNLSVEPLPQGNTLAVSWDDVSGDCMGYELFLLEESDWTPLAHLSDGTTLFLHQNLTDGAEYTYTLASYDEVPNRSPISAPVTGVPSDTLPPATPRDLSIMPLPEGNALLLEWICEIEDVQGYNIYVIKSNNWTLISNSTKTSKILQDLDNNEVYILGVTAIDEVPNESEHSVPMSGTPKDITPPQVPDNLIVSPGPGEGEITIQWTPNLDDTIHYSIERSLNGASWDALNFTTVALFIDVGLVMGVEYLYRVVATDDDGLHSAPTDEVGSEALDLTPPPPPVLDPIPGFLNTNELTVTGRAESLSFVETMIHGIIHATGRADELGRFEMTVSGLTEGVHSVEARATDYWNNTSPVSATKWFTVDTVSPVVMRITPDLSSSVRPDSDLEIKLSEQTNDLVVLLRSPKTTIEIELSHISSDIYNTSSYHIPADIKDGNYILVISGSDIIGNEFDFQQEVRVSSERGSEEDNHYLLLVLIIIAAILFSTIILLYMRRPR